MTATGQDQNGVVRLVGAHVTGQLHMERARLHNGTGPALQADGLRVDTTSFLDRLVATGHGELGAVRLLGATITGQLLLRNAILYSSTGPALHADGLRVKGMTILDNLRAYGRGEVGAVVLGVAHLSGQLSMSRAKIYNETGPALQADGVQVDGSAVLDHLDAVGHYDSGAVRLLGARITDQLSLVDAVLRSNCGPSLAADKLRVEGSIVLGGLRATGHGQHGAVRLSDVHCTGRLSVRGTSNPTTLTNETGPALRGERLRVDSDVYLVGLTANGGGELASLHLPGAHIRGDLELSGSVIAAGEQRLILDLEHAHVEGRLSLFDEPFWHDVFRRPEDQQAQVLLSGFTYLAQPQQPCTQTWLQVLQTCTPRYAPQPYRQLAEACRKDGDEEQAKAVLIAQQDAFHATLDDRMARSWHRLSGVTVRYGYRPGRAFAGLIVVLVISCAIMLVATVFGLLLHPASRSSGHCGIVETIGEAVTRTMPLLRFATYGGCELTTTKPAQAVYLALLFFQALGWAFLTLFVAGFTGIIRKYGT
jgi:hypothetical protein